MSLVSGSDSNGVRDFPPPSQEKRTIGDTDNCGQDIEDIGDRPQFLRAHPFQGKYSKYCACGLHNFEVFHQLCHRRISRISGTDHGF